MIDARARSPSWLAGLACALVVMATRDARADERVEACADAAEQGQEVRDRGGLVEARALFVSCAQRECPVTVRDSCTEWLADIDRRMPSIVVAAKDTRGRDLTSLVASLDGRRLPDSVATTAVAVNPGRHTLRVEAPGYEPASEEIVLREGEPHRLVPLTLRQIGGVWVPAPPARRGIPALSLALGGTSLVALGVWGYFGLTGAAEYDRLEKSCAPACPDGDVHRVRTAFLVADIALVVGVVTLAAANAIWILDRRAPASRGAARR